MGGKKRKFVFYIEKEGAWKACDLLVSVPLQLFYSFSITSWIHSLNIQWCVVVYDPSSAAKEKHHFWKDTDSKGCSLAGAGKWSNSTFKEIAAVDGVSRFPFVISESY